MDLSKYRHLYLSETQENLEKLGRLLVRLESEPTHRESIDTVFRLYHSIKGMSATMGYKPLSELAHQLEDLMDRVRRDGYVLPADYVDVLLAGVDRITQWLGDIEHERPLEVDDAAASVLARVKELLGIEPTPPPLKVVSLSPPPLPAEDGDLVVHLEVDPSCPDPGVRGFLLYRKLRDLAEICASSPDLETLRAGRLDGGLRMVLRTSLAPERLTEFIRLMPDWHRVDVHRHVAPPPPPPEDDLVFSGDLDLFDDPPEPEPEETPVQAAAIVRAPRSARTIRVRTDWLDTLLDRIGDLLIISQRLWNLNQQQPRPATSQGLAELSRVLNALHQDALTVRMTSLSVLTNRLPRVVRDMARDAGKRASLVVRGDDQRLDRAIIEGLDSPLTHLLRNAVEHGIESPELREAQGKPRGGVLTLECLRVRDEIVVTLADDGAGVDRARLVERAVQLGLMERGRATTLAERDLARLMALPGLTARDQPGALAGRGVGFDAVHEAIGALGGRVEVESEPGAGTTVRLRLPRTPGISKLLLVEADGQVFGLPLGRIVRTDLFHADQTERAQGVEFVHTGDDRHRLHHLRHLLGLPASDSLTKFPGVVYSDGRQPFVIGVDRVVGQQDAVIKPLGPLLERIDGLLGVTIDPVGQPVFVVDVTRFVPVA